MGEVDTKRIGEILVSRGLLNFAQMQEALEIQKQSGQFLGEILVSRGWVGEEQIARTLGEQLGYAFVELKEMQPEPKAIQMISQEICLKNSVMPIYISQNTLMLAMANALDVQALDQVQKISGLRVRPVFACPSAIRQAIQKHYGAPAAKATSPEAKMIVNTDPVFRTAREEKGGKSSEASNQLQQAANLESIVTKVNEIVRKAVEMGASDIHLEPERTKLECRFRVDGILQSILSVPAADSSAIISRVKIMGDMDIAEKRLPQDGRARVSVKGHEVDLRISTFPTLYGENVVVRILDRTEKLLHLADLGFSRDNLAQFQKLIQRPYGIILVAGPTGSGKTTSLYAAINEINSTQKNIITLEDPVEYELPHVRQSQINAKAGLTFANGLRSILRQDPDIIMIGEIRDRETAEIAIHAALTGHLVFSTIHTNDAPSGITRMIDMGVEPFLVASSIIGILAQRLVRTLCPHCKEGYPASTELLAQLNLSGTAKPVTVPEVKKVQKFSKEIGCPECKNLGYLGRCGIYELLTPTDRIKQLTIQKASASMISDEAIKNGMKTLRESGIEKVIEGITSISELLRVTEDI